MTLAFNILGLLVLAVLIGLFLRLGRRPRTTLVRQDRPRRRDREGGAAPRSR